MNYNEDYNDYEPNYEACDSDYDDGIDWREETWYALTDGQYGDYPCSDIDYDFLGF